MAPTKTTWGRAAVICPLLRGFPLYQRSFFLSCVVRNHRRPFIIIPSLQQNAAGIAQRHPLQCARVYARTALETERNAVTSVGFLQTLFPSPSFAPRVSLDTHGARYDSERASNCCRT